MTQLTGPSIDQDWQAQDVVLGDGTAVPVLTLADADSAADYVLPASPQLARSNQGKPLIALSLVLSEQPSLEASNIRSLVARGLLTLDVGLHVAPAVLDVLAAQSGRSYRRLFARRVVYQLRWFAENASEPPVVLATAEASGPEARAALGAQLDRDQTLDILTTLDGGPSRLELCADVDYRVVGVPVRVSLDGVWATIHDTISANLDEESRVSAAALSSIILAMAAAGVFAVTGESGRPIPLAGEELTRLFLRQSSVILRPLPDAQGMPAFYTVRPRPHESFHLRYSESVQSVDSATHRLCAALHEVMGSAAGRFVWDDHIQLVAPSTADPAYLEPVVRRVRAARRARSNRGTTGSFRVAVMSSAVASLAVATRPQTSAAVRPQVAAAHMRPQAAAGHLMLDDLRVELPHRDLVRSLPVIHDVNAPYWHDRLSKSKTWYAPELVFVQPDPTDSVDTSPFLFSFERTGVTNAGQPALRATIRLTLRQTLSAATETALERDNRRSAHPVPLNSLSVSLLVPFVDATDGRLKQHALEAQVTQVGDDIVVAVPVLNEWVRLSYGALAMAGFQTQPVQVRIAYAFTGYVVVKEKELELAFGGKALHTRVVYSAADAGAVGSGYLNAATLTYVKPTTSVRYQREAPVPPSRVARPAGVSFLSRPQAFVARPVVGARPLVAASAAVRPQLAVAVQTAALLRKVKYATRSQVRRQTETALVACSRLGRFYQELREGTATAIGCQDALTLGQTRYRQYEEIVALRDPDYRVYRSLQQPGNFLVVPTRFCISRRAAGEDDAYRPLVFLNALLDADVPANNRVELRATLQPEIAVFKVRALKARLSLLDPQPIVHFPTDIPTESVAVRWALDPSIVAEGEGDIMDADGPFISTFFSLDLAGWQLLRAVLEVPGVSGSITFGLADGSELSSNLLLRLDRVRGPWESGPLEVTSSGAQLELRNRIEQSVDVAELVRYSGAVVAETVPVETSVAPGEAVAVQGAGDLVPVYTYPAGDSVSITEVRSFVEDIYSNLIFINLLNFDSHNLTRLDVEARVQGIAGRHTAQLSDEVRVADIPIVLPLTTYLAQHVLEFRVTKVFTNRVAEMTEWLQWDLDTTVPVSLTCDLIRLPCP